MKHIKYYLVCWKYTMRGQETYHMQHYESKEIAADKVGQLLCDSGHVRSDDIKCRPVIFKFCKS